MYNGLGMEVTEKQYNIVSRVMSSFSLLACWVILHVFLSSSDFFQIKLFL